MKLYKLIIVESLTWNNKKIYLTIEISKILIKNCKIYPAQLSMILLATPCVKTKECVWTQRLTNMVYNYYVYVNNALKMLILILKRVCQ